MRWTTKLRHPPAPQKLPQVGDTREIFPFLWLPRTIGLETRWMERAGILQEYCDRGFGHPWPDQGWEDSEWRDYPTMQSWYTQHQWKRPGK